MAGVGLAPIHGNARGFRVLLGALPPQLRRSVAPVTTPRDQLIEAIAEETFINYEQAGQALQVLSELGAVVLMPVQVAEIPKGSTVHLPPPTVSLNWPEGAYRPFVNGDSKVYVDALKGTR